MVILMGVFNNIFKLFLPIIFIASVFCDENNSLTDDEVIQLFHTIKELEYKDSLNIEIINNLELQVVDYQKLHNNNLLQIEDYKKQVELKEQMIDLVKPKWYHNRYLWFFGGITITASSVYLAGQIK